MWRFSLPRLFAAILVIAFFCAALAACTSLWMHATRTLVALVLLGSIVVALCARGRARAFAIGLAVFGSALFYLTVGEIDEPGKLPSHDLLDWAYGALWSAPQWTPPPAPPGSFFSVAPSAEVFEYQARRTYFMEIGDMAIVAILGFLGGIIGAVAYSRSHRDDQT
jgi:hypothetical protein